MSENNIFMKMQADPSGMVRALEMVYEKVDKLTKAVDKQKQGMTDLDREAKRALQSIMTDEEKRAQKLERLNLLREKGKLTEEQYNLVLARQQQVVQQSVRTQDGWTAMAFKTAAALGGVAAVQQLIVSTLNAEIELRQKIAGMVETSAGGLGKLMQMASSPADAQRLLKGARTLRERGAAGSLSQAADLMFTIESAGLGANFDTIARIGASGLFPDTGSFAGSVNQITSAFGAEAGDFNAIASKGLVGGGMLKATAEQFMAAVARSAGQGGENALGLSDEEISAFTVAIGNAIGIQRTPEVGSGTLRAFTKLGYSGKSIEQIVEDIDRRKLSPAKLIEYLGESTAAEGFSALKQNLGRYKEALPKFRDANSGGRLLEQLSIAENALDPAIQLKRQAGREESGMVFDQGEYASLLESLRREQAVINRNRFGGFFGGLISGTTNRLEEMLSFGSETAQLRTFLRGAGSEGVNPQLGTAILEALRKNNDISERQYENFKEYLSRQNNAAPQSQPQKEQ